MTTDNNQPIDDQPVSPHQRVLKVAPQVYYGRPNPQLMRIHADDVQGTLPQGELPEEHGGELVGYSPVPVPYRKPGTGRRVVEALAYLALAIAANPFVYFLLPSYTLSEETLGSLYLAGIGFSVLSIGILPLTLFFFSLWALINFLGVMVRLIWRRKAGEKLTFRLVYDCAPPSKTNQERYASRHRSGITQPVMSSGGSSDSSQKGGGEASVLCRFRAESLYCGGDSLHYGPVRGGATRRSSLYDGESGERRAHGDSRHHLVCGVDSEPCAAYRSGRGLCRLATGSKNSCGIEPPRTEHTM